MLRPASKFRVAIISTVKIPKHENGRFNLSRVKVNLFQHAEPFSVDNSDVIYTHECTNFEKKIFQNTESLKRCTVRVKTRSHVPSVRQGKLLSFY